MKKDTPLEAAIKSRYSVTTDYDPRYDRAQTVEGAKARYVEGLCSLSEFEADVERILDEGEYPDEAYTPVYEHD